MKRVIVLGGLGLFGRTACAALKALGVPALTSGRASAADLRVDANDAGSIVSAFKSGDVVIDAAGPFQTRSTAVIEAAIQVGFDVIDLNDDLGYAEKVVAHELAIEQAGIRVLTSASSVSAVSATAVRLSKIVAPVRVTSFLAPASRHTANAGSALSLIRSVGQPVRARRDGELRTLRGWGESRSFPLPEPLGRRSGWLFESADALHLPRIWPTLETVDMFVDTNTPGANWLLRCAAHVPILRLLLERQVRLGTWLSRRFGSNAGGIGYEIEGPDGSVERVALVSAENSFLVAVAPAVLAAKEILEGSFLFQGLVTPDRHVEPPRLTRYLQNAGIQIVTSRDAPGC